MNKIYRAKIKKLSELWLMMIDVIGMIRKTNPAGAGFGFGKWMDYKFVLAGASIQKMLQKFLLIYRLFFLKSFVWCSIKLLDYFSFTIFSKHFLIKSFYYAV